MKLKTDEVCCNAINLVDENGIVIACVNGPQEGGWDITERERTIAELICDAFNADPDSDNID